MSRIEIHVKQVEVHPAMRYYYITIDHEQFVPFHVQIAPECPPKVGGVPVWAENPPVVEAAILAAAIRTTRGRMARRAARALRAWAEKVTVQASPGHLLVAEGFLKALRGDVDPPEGPMERDVHVFLSEALSAIEIAERAYEEAGGVWPPNTPALKRAGVLIGEALVASLELGKVEIDLPEIKEIDILFS